MHAWLTELIPTENKLFFAAARKKKMSIYVTQRLLTLNVDIVISCVPLYIILILRTLTQLTGGKFNLKQTARESVLCT